MALLLFGVATVLVPAARPLGRDLLAFLFVVAYEVLMACTTRATLGKIAAEIELRSLGVAGSIPVVAAVRRAIPVGLCIVIAPAGTLVALAVFVTLVISIVLSPRGRGYHDRAAGTVVVRSGAPDLVTERDVEAWFDLAHQPVLASWGRAADLTERRRARAARLDDAPWLVLLLVGMTAALSAALRSPWALAWTALAWYVAFVADETWRIARHGATAGHRAAGLVVVDTRTGQPPDLTHSFIRAAVLGPLLYVPPLQIVLALWVRGSTYNRGPHDAAAHTMVVEPDYVAPPPLIPAPAYPAWGWAPAPYGWPQPMQPGWAAPAPQGWYPPPPTTPPAPQPGWHAPPPPPTTPPGPQPGWHAPPPPPTTPPGPQPGWHAPPPPHLVAGWYPPPHRPVGWDAAPGQPTAGRPAPPAPPAPPLAPPAAEPPPAADAPAPEPPARPPSQTPSETGYF